MPIIAGAVAFLLSAGVIRLVLLSPALKDRLAAQPVAHRWHQQATPSFGGIAIFTAVSAALIVTGGLTDPVVLGMLLGAAVVFLTGLLDDVRDLKPRVKLMGEAVGALAIVIMAGGEFSLALVVAAVIWIVLMANSVNLLDNMDGLAAGTSVVSLVFVLPILVSASQTDLVLTSAAVIGALLGFLLYNRHPAKIFMGDSGSLWLGLVLGATVALTEYGDARYAPITAATLLAVPLIDTGTVVVSRLRSGRSIMLGGKDHLSHRLVRLGLNDKQAVQVLTLAAVVCGIVAVMSVVLPTAIWIMIVAVVWISLLVLAVALLRTPVYQQS